jgi:TRAP transporter TAXI family solute receptor
MWDDRCGEGGYNTAATAEARYNEAGGSTMDNNKDYENNTARFAALRPVARLMRVSVKDLAITSIPLVLLTLLVIWLAYWYVRPAPPDTIVMTAGAPGSSYLVTAEKYRKILARNGVKLKVLQSAGSLENLKRLTDPKYKVDIGFVQGGVATGLNIDGLYSLGSIFHQPLSIFYRGDRPFTLLSELAGKRIAIGPEGSGTHVLAAILLKANGIEPGGKSELLNLGGEEAAQALVDGKVDAAFLMGDSATPPVMRRLLWTPGVRLLDFKQAEGYARRYPYLLKLDLPMGVFDFGKNVPQQPINLIGPTVELVARKSLHPALSDLLIEAAKEVHGKATLLQHSGEFPAPLEHEFPVSPDAKRFYSSGKGFFYRWLPFWMATLLDRTLVVFVPIVVLLIPGLKLLPTLYNWRIRSRIYRWYGALISIERSMLANPTPDEREDLLKRLDEIEMQVNRMKIPLSFAEQFYVLRDHIQFVGDRYRQGVARG